MDIDPDEFRKKLVESRILSQRKKKSKIISLDKGIYITIKADYSDCFDEEGLLIKPNEFEIEESFKGVIEKVKSLGGNNKITKSGQPNYKILVFIYLNSKQGPKTQTGGIFVNISMSYQEFKQILDEKFEELEARYIGGEEYNQQQLILSRCINIQFYYQVWDVPEPPF